MLSARRLNRPSLLRVGGAIFFFTFVVRYLWPAAPAESILLAHLMNHNVSDATYVKSSFDWSSVKFAHPPAAPPSPPLPGTRAARFPRIQHPFGSEPKADAAVREGRRHEVRNVFARDWESYRKYAWKKDALNPIAATPKDQFCGWAATLVDSLDTLWIMGMRREFDEAVAAVAELDFGKTSNNRVNMFETNIRYLGGLLSAYDLSGREVLRAKAVELGDLLYAGFNTPNRMPVDFIDFERAKTGEGLEVEEWVVLASPGSLSMEMTRLSQVTGDTKYYDAITEVMKLFAEKQSNTRIPGLWPMWVSMRNKNVDSREEFTMGGSADSAFEYLPKMWALLGGRDFMYENMTKNFMTAADDNLFFRPMLPDEKDILFSGNVKMESDKAVFDPESEHLTCFIGGAVALGGRLVGTSEDVRTGTKLAKGCAYAYHAFPTGMMPERFNAIPCNPARATDCRWSQQTWILEAHKRPEFKLGLPKGFTTAKDARYILRPEAIESLFVTYRLTGEKELQESAWKMFQAISKGTEVEHGHAAVKDVTSTEEKLEKEDYMESFWYAETLKYFYLIFSPPDVISLDEYVLNTEAHPFRMPK